MYDFDIDILNNDWQLTCIYCKHKLYLVTLEHDFSLFILMLLKTKRNCISLFFYYEIKSERWIKDQLCT